MWDALPAAAEPADGAKEHHKYLDKNILNALILSWGRESGFNPFYAQYLSSAMVSHLSNLAPILPIAICITCSNFSHNDHFTPKGLRLTSLFLCKHFAGLLLYDSAHGKGLIQFSLPEESGFQKI